MRRLAGRSRSGSQDGRIGRVGFQGDAGPDELAFCIERDGGGHHLLRRTSPAVRGDFEMGIVSRSPERAGSLHVKCAFVEVTQAPRAGTVVGG